MKPYSVFQPIFNLSTSEVIGYEAFIRGVGSPEKFFRSAVKKKKISEMDHMARRLAIESYVGSGKLFLNCHPLSFEKGIDLYKHPNIQDVQLVIEITEQRILDTSHIQHQVKQLKKNGVEIALDDFGHGFTNLSLIEILEPTYIKLDKMLIRNVRNKKVQQLLKGIMKLADDIQCLIIAEGIETGEQLKGIQECGVIFGQGWYLGRPIQFSKASKILTLI